MYQKQIIWEVLPYRWYDHIFTMWQGILQKFNQQWMCSMCYWNLQWHSQCRFLHFLSRRRDNITGRKHKQLTVWLATVNNITVMINELGTKPVISATDYNFLCIWLFLCKLKTGVLLSCYYSNISPIAPPQREQTVKNYYFLFPATYMALDLPLVFNGITKWHPSQDYFDFVGWDNIWVFPKLLHWICWIQ